MVVMVDGSGLRRDLCSRWWSRASCCGASKNAHVPRLLSGDATVLAFSDSASSNAKLLAAACAQKLTSVFPCPIL